MPGLWPNLWVEIFMEVHFYNHVNKSTFKSALISGTFESASILCGTCCLVHAWIAPRWEVGFWYWGAKKFFSRQGFFPRKSSNFLQVRLFSTKNPWIFSKARLFLLIKPQIRPRLSRRDINIGGAMAPLAPSLPPSLCSTDSLVNQHTKKRRTFDSKELYYY